MKEEKKPFFSRFLENMEEKELNNAKAGGLRATMKYPSDDDEAIYE